MAGRTGQLPCAALGLALALANGSDPPRANDRTVSVRTGGPGAAGARIGLESPVPDVTCKEPACPARCCWAWPR